MKYDPESEKSKYFRCENIFRINFVKDNITHLYTIHLNINVKINFVGKKMLWSLSYGMYSSKRVVALK